MSTKNLARTVIEGGRYSGNGWERRKSNAQLRVQERNVESALRFGADRDDFVVPKRPPVRPLFRDKLNPAKRWLDRQVGCPWSKVLSELKERFDTRTTPGRHIVCDHMLTWVQVGDVPPHRFGFEREFRVDRYGILRRLLCPPLHIWNGPAPRERLLVPPAELERWLNGRRVGERGPALFWFTPTPLGAFRQHNMLDDVDAAFWRSLPAWFRKENAAMSVAALAVRR